MGGWGYYDDENDYIADITYDVENQVLPDNLKEKTGGCSEITCTKPVKIKTRTGVPIPDNCTSMN